MIRQETRTQEACRQNTAQDNAEKTRQLLAHPELWRAGQLAPDSADRATRALRSIASGYVPLDAQLPDGGWPRAGLAEVLHAQPGLGELRLLAPALAELSQQQNRWVAWVGAPAIPYAPALARLGIRNDRMLLIHPKNHADALWAAEQAARSGTCSAVLIWLDAKHLKHKETRRLQVAAKQGNSFACLFLPPTAAQQASAAELRVALHSPFKGNHVHNRAAHNSLQVDILKRRGGWALENIDVQLAGDDPVKRKQDIVEQFDLWEQARTASNKKPSIAEAKKINRRPENFIEHLHAHSTRLDSVRRLAAAHRPTSANQVTTDAKLNAAMSAAIDTAMIATALKVEGKTRRTTNRGQLH
jgi:cell division inhibitor SulA